MSPRSVVRVAAVDAYGAVVNEYTGRKRVAGSAPVRPWAVYLADDERRFRLLCFDLDAKTPAAAVAAARDADVLTGLIHAVGLDSVVCQSGPTGGRHVWTALTESVDAETVATLARLVRHLCPTLDLAPLSNPATGCVRPPGAPHRDGGHSTVLAGSLDTLTAPTGTAAQVARLVEAVGRLVDDAEPIRDLDPGKPVPLDEHARLYLPGPRRPLPAVSAAALDQHAAASDASAVLWQILIGAAAARWRHSDVAARADTAPGLEHVRTVRDGDTRSPRGRGWSAKVLREQWDKAVRYVAATGRQIGDDPTFNARAGQLAAHVRDVQVRADGCAGRWATGGGPSDRRVLDTLCVLALNAVRTTVEADTRRLALHAGIGRETARTALQRLAADGWITQAQSADGPHGAHWTITPITPAAVIHTPIEDARSQADPRPPCPGSAQRSALTATLTARLTDAAHDLFTHTTASATGLGHHAGNTYARLLAGPLTLDDIAQTTGATRTHTARTLDQLTDAGVLVHTSQGWRRHRTDYRTAAAIRYGVDGRLADRARRYELERELWAWWQAEHAWLHAPRRTPAKRRPGPGQLALAPETGTHAYGPHPRHADGRLDWRAARHSIEHERGRVARRPWAPRAPVPPTPRRARIA